jgi:hypothetical protein
MRRIPTFISLAPAVVLLVVAWPRDARAQSTSDAKLWAGVSGRLELIDRVRFDVEQQERIGADQGMESSLTELGARLRLRKYLAVGAQYRLAIVDPDGVAHRLAGDVRLQASRARWTAQYRLRLQRGWDSMESKTTVRNKVGLSYDLTKRVTPFVETEAHYLTTNSEWREVRLAFGIDAALTKRIDLGAFYMFQSEFNKSVDETNHIIGVGLSYTFKRTAKKGKKKVGDEDEVDEDKGDAGVSD